MSEPQVDAPPSDAPSTTFLLDGDAPRLGGGTSTPPAPPTVAFEPPVMAAPTGQASPHGPSPLLSAPGAAPLLGSTDLSPRPALPTISEPVVPAPVADAPMLPTVAAPTPIPVVAPVTVPVHAAEPDTDVAPSAPTNAHPMAHLMPEKAAVSEASKRAAEIRAAKKAKARKIKIGAALAALVVAVLAGPPLVGWVSDALDDAGSTTTVDG